MLVISLLYVLLSHFREVREQELDVLALEVVVESLYLADGSLDLKVLFLPELVYMDSHGEFGQIQVGLVGLDLHRLFLQLGVVVIKDVFIHYY